LLPAQVLVQGTDEVAGVFEDAGMATVELDGGRVRHPRGERCAGFLDWLRFGAG
jgi:hypothetical protein